MKSVINKYVKPIAYIMIVATVAMSCESGDKYFKDERYKKMIYVISDKNQIFHAEYELLNAEEAVNTLPFAVSGTNSIDRDVYITVEKDPDIVLNYNYATYMDETDKYAHELKEGEYSLPTTSAEIKSGRNLQDEVGKLAIHIKKGVLERLSVDSTYFIPFRIKEASPYEVNESKMNVMFQVYKKNAYATQKTKTYYTSIGYKGDAYFSTSKRVDPISYNKVRVYVGSEVFSSADTEEAIAKKAMNLVVHEDNTVTMEPYDVESSLQVNALQASNDPNDGSGTYAYKNIYSPEERCFYLYYSYDWGDGEVKVREQLKLEE